MTISNTKNTVRAAAAVLRLILLPKDYPVWVIVALTLYYFGVWQITGIISSTVAQENRMLLKQEGIILGCFIVLVEVLNQITYWLGQKNHDLAVRLKAVLFWCIYTAGAGTYIYLASNVEGKVPWGWNQGLGQTLFQILFCWFLTIYSLCPSYRFLLLCGSFTTTRRQFLALKDDDKRVRLKAAEFFFLKRGKKVTEALIELLDDSDKEIRCATILALSARGEKRILDEFEGRLNNEDEELRSEALMGLYLSRSRKRSEALFNALQNKHEDVRNSAALLLGDTGDKRAIEPLTKLLKYSTDDSVKEVASKVLAKFNDS
ncbi:MAG: HEAT repeat domain-containing protein [Phycisphaerales bacterium]|nr:MAG: HEAT repeat domain-containing protein [Phycisphaerales bacterium]